MMVDTNQRCSQFSNTTLLALIDFFPGHQSVGIRQRSSSTINSLNSEVTGYADEVTNPKS